MKGNKDLQDIADRSLDSLRDNEFKQRLIAEQKAINNSIKDDAVVKRSKTIRLKAALTFSVCLILALGVLMTTLLLNINKADPPRHYALDDVYIENVQLDEVYNAVKIDFPFEKVTRAAVAKDKKTDDILFYRVDVEDEENFISCKIQFITNKYFTPSETDTDTLINVNGMEIKLSSKVDFLQSDGIYIFDIYAETKIDDVRIVINNYQKMAVEEDSGFEEFVREFFVK